MRLNLSGLGSFLETVMGKCSLRERLIYLMKMLISLFSCSSLNLWLFCFKFPQDCLQSSKLLLTHFTQGLDVNIVQANLSDLIPLFGDSSTPSAQTKHDSPQVKGSDTALAVTELVSVKSDNIFFDKSLFDDGMEESGNYVEHDSVMETNQMTEKESEDNKAGPVPSSQDSTNTGFSESQPKEEIGKGERGPGDAEGTKHSDEKERKRVHKKPTNGMKCIDFALFQFQNPGGVKYIHN